MTSVTKIQTDYDRASLSHAIRESGIILGDTVFCHSNVGFFGRPDCELSAVGVGQMILDAVFDVIGDHGTFIVPTFSYSFVKGQDFNPAVTPSVCGALTEFIRNHDDSYRSHHPDFSIAAVGSKAQQVTEQVPRNAFGPDSFFDRFEGCDGKFCNFNFDSGSTFVHHVERTLNVPYRYEKKFFGNIVIDQDASPSYSSWYVHDLTAPGLEAAFEPFHEKAIASGVSTVVPLGRGSVCTLSARRTRQLIEDTIKEEPFFLTLGQGADLVSGIVPCTEISDIDREVLDEWRKNKDVGQIENALSKLKRVGVTSGSHAAVELIADLLPVEIYDIPTGTLLNDIIIPERWTLIKSSITSKEEQNLRSQSDHPVAAHSRNFSADVSGKVLTESVIEYDNGQYVDHGGFGVLESAIGNVINPGETYSVDIAVENKFGAMRYAVLPGEHEANHQPHYIDLSQSADDIAKILTGLVSSQDEYPATIIFYVQPFDPEAIYAHYINMRNA